MMATDLLGGEASRCIVKQLDARQHALDQWYDSLSTRERALDARERGLQPDEAVSRATHYDAIDHRRPPSIRRPYTRGQH